MDGAISLILQIGGPLLILPDLSIRSVCRPIDFDDKLLFAANEIAEIGTKWCLLNEFEALQPAPTQTLPKLFLGCGLSTSQFFCTARFMKM